MFYKKGDPLRFRVFRNSGQRAQRGRQWERPVISPMSSVFLVVEPSKIISLI